MFGNLAKWIRVVIVAPVLVLAVDVAQGHDHGHHYCRETSSYTGADCEHCFNHDHYYCGQTGMRGAGSCNFCFQAADVASATSVQGTVRDIQIGPGHEFPHIALLTQDGKELRILVAPFWYLRDRGFNLKTGDTLTVRMAKITTLEGDREVALELEQKEGKTLKLRNENGFPMWTKGRSTGCCP